MLFLKIPKVRKYFNIDEKKKIEQEKKKNKGVIGEFKESKVLSKYFWKLYLYIRNNFEPFYL